MEHALRPGGAERELEQPLGDRFVRPDEPTLVGSVQSSLVPEVDRDPIHPKQLCDPIGDGLGFLCGAKAFTQGGELVASNACERVGRAHAAP